MEFRSDLRRLVDHLMERLEVAAELYTDDPIDGAGAAVAAAANFVSSVSALKGAPGGQPRPQLAEPLLRVGLALAGVKDGVRDQLFVPAEKTKTGDPPAKRMEIARIAAVLDILMGTGLTEREAAKMVARSLEGSTLMAKLRGNPPTSIINWRKQIKSAHVHGTDPSAAAGGTWEFRIATYYNMIVDGAQKTFGSDAPPDEIRRTYLALLRQWHPRKRRRES